MIDYDINHYGKYTINVARQIKNKHSGNIVQVENNEVRIYDDHGNRNRISVQEIYDRSLIEVDCKRKQINFLNIEVDNRGVIWYIELPSKRVELRHDAEGIIEWCRTFNPELQYNYPNFALFRDVNMNRLSKNSVRLINPHIIGCNKILSFSNMFCKSVVYGPTNTPINVVSDIITSERVPTLIKVPHHVFTNNMATTNEVTHFLIPIKGSSHWIPESALDMSMLDMFKAIESS